MRISIDSQVFNQFPTTKMGFVVASFDQQQLRTETIDSKISELQKLLLEKGFKLGESVKPRPRIAVWRNAYSQFGCNPNEFPSSIESLTRRALNGKFPRLLPVIDFYNAYSVDVQFPMGGYDLEKLTGDISLTLAGKEGLFTGIGSKEPVTMAPKHVVYKDGEGVICWAWNQKDAERTAITEGTGKAVFFIDSLDDRAEGGPSLENAVLLFKEQLNGIGAVTHADGCLSQKSPACEVDLSLLRKVEQKKAAAVSEELLPDVLLSDSKESFDITHLAAIGQYSLFVEAAAKHPLSMLKKDANGHTVLMHAAVGRSVPITRFILARLHELQKTGTIEESDRLEFINATSKFRVTALDAARKHGQSEIESLLSQAGAK